MTAGAPSALLALGALASGVIVLFALRAMPRAGFVLWGCVAFFVPVWVGASLGVFWPAIIAMTAVMIAVNARHVPLLPADGAMVAFAILVLGLHLLDSVTLGDAVTAMLEWVIPYIWGRIALARVSTRVVTSVIAVLACTAAALAVFEFATSFNPFVLIPGAEPLYSEWSPLQERGGILRAEGAFGHSIALGAVLAMSSAFALAAPWRMLPRTLAAAVIAAGAVVTFSRAGLVTLVLTVMLSIWLLPGLSRRFRAVTTAAGTLGAAAALPIVSAVFDAAGDEASGSAGYRTDLLILLGQVKLFGNPGEWESLVMGDHYLGYFARSIDNSLMVSLIRYGAVPTVLAFGVIAVAAALVLQRGRRNPAAIAVAGQLPSLAVVALITQYGALLWFCVGLALAWGQVRQREVGAGHPVDELGASEGEELGVSSYRVGGEGT